MNFELSATNLLELEQIITTLLVESKCACHVINPNKTRILMWKEVSKDGQVTYQLRIGIQKFVSREQTDRNGEIYWRYWTYESKKTEGSPENQPQKMELKEVSTDPNSITKYQQRLAKTQILNHHGTNSDSNQG